MPPPPTMALPPSDEVIALEPAMDTDLDRVRAALATNSFQAVSASTVEQSHGSILGETSTLRRHRLAATALLLAICYFALLAWQLVFRPPHTALAWSLIGSRFFLTACVAGLLLSPLRLSPLHIRRWKCSSSAG